MTYSSEETGKIIKNLRNSKNWSQTTLGKEIGVSGKQISSYEKGQPCPPIDVLFKLCDIFNCELGFLLGEEDYSSGTKIATAIEDELGLNTDSISSLKYITGKERKCISFGDQSAYYRKIVNNFISSPYFSSLIESISDLDESINLKEKIWSDLEEKYEPDILNQAHDYHNSTTDYYHVNQSEQLPEIYYQAMNDIDEAIDKDISKSYNVKVARYEVKEAFERLLDLLYPLKRN